MKTRTHFPVLFTLLSGLLLWPAIASAQEEVVYYHTDAIGSVRAITDHNGDEIARYDYLPFGELWPTDPPQPNERRQFAGKERDFETTGLDYFGARYHRPVSGRFTTVDPVMNVEAAFLDPQRWNRYAYAKNNPYLFVDPDGRDIVMLNPYSQAAMARAGQIRDAVSSFFAGDHPHARFGRAVADAVLASFLPRNNDEAAAAANAQVLGLAAPLEIGGAGALARLKPVNLPGWRSVAIDMEEVISGHTSTGQRAIQSGIKTVFPDGMSGGEIEGAIRNAYRYGSKILTQGDRVKIQGPWRGGTIELWLNKGTKTIETAYPLF